MLHPTPAVTVIASSGCTKVFFMNGERIEIQAESEIELERKVDAVFAAPEGTES
jgi:hypothetical protein